ncbi:MAG: TetR/AcrR family transcriptional regulator [Myxococcales bacterium]|nr:TetR/AcrR family transcriptional regulator [Myxococcales bacterium]
MRRIPEHRFDDLIDGTTEVFIERGYHRTQMSDVAEAIGVAKGTLYGYVESKEALFALCLQHADRDGPVPRPAVLPVPTPPAGSLEAWAKQRIADQSVPPPLAEALEKERAEDPRAEFAAIVRALYVSLETNRHAIKLIDRSIDHPRLGAIWQTAGRETGRATLRRYLASRIAAGQLRAVPNLQLAARMIVEVLATWGVHIHWDRAPEDFDPDEARENAIDFLVRGFLP